MKKEVWTSVVLLLICTFFWSVNSVVGRAYAGEVPPLTMSLGRWVGASIILIGFTFKELKPVIDYFKKYPLRIISLSFLNITMYNTLLYSAAQTTQSININLINTLIPPVTVLMALFVNKSKISLKGALGLVFAFLGTMLIISRGDASKLMRMEFFNGDLIMLAAVFFWGAYSVLLNKFDVRLKMLPLMAVLMVTGTIILFFIQLLLPGTPSFTPTVAHIPLFLFLWICPSILSNIFWYYGVQNLGAGQASFAIYSMPIFGSIIGFFVLGESLAPYHLGGALLIAVGFLLNFSRARQKTKKPS